MATSANLEDVPSVDLMTELLRRMKCSSKPDKRLILIDALCKRLNGLISKFWWSHNVDRRNIYWTSNSQLWKGKDSGGLGFRDFSCVNDALLTKQLWRLLRDNNTLLSKVFRAKYFKNGSGYPSLGSNPSFAWRSIWKAGKGLWTHMVENHNGFWKWNLESSGIYTVKSAYTALSDSKNSVSLTRTGESSDISNLRIMWKTIWRLKVQEKVKFFIWKLFYNALPLFLNLRKRGCDVTTTCQICGYELEDSKHLFFECWWARSFWHCVNFSNLHEMWLSGSVQDCVYQSTINLSSDNLALLFCGLRMIWFNRNLNSHDHEFLNPFNAARGVQDSCRFFASPYFKFAVSDIDAFHTWELPSAGYIKINCDAAMYPGDCNAAVACVARDHEGVVLEIFTDLLNNVKSVKEAEGTALLLATKWAQNRGWLKCEFEVDNAEVYEAVLRNQRIQSNSVDAWMNCSMDLAVMDKWNLVLIRREANVFADSLAKRALKDNWVWNCSVAVPR